MAKADVVNEGTLSRVAERVAAQGEYALRVAMVYEDPPSHRWGAQVCERVTRLVGQECFFSTAWPISELGEPHKFPEAVQAAAKADVIVVSVRASEGLPLDLYVWIDAWLPRRTQGMGALVALIGVPGCTDADSAAALDYLKAVAHKGNLDFLPQERKLPAEPPEVIRVDSLAERATTTTQVLNDILRDSHGAFRGYGINE
jgi:hypothetical protein